MLMSDCKHGFRAFADTMSVSLLRGSRDPDMYPEYGVRSFRFALAAVAGCSGVELKAQADRLIHTPVVSACDPCENAFLPPCGSFISVEGVRLGAVKLSRNGQGLVLRLINMDGEAKRYSIRLPAPIASAQRTDINETILDSLTAEDGAVTGTIDPAVVETVLVTLA